MRWLYTFIIFWVVIILWGVILIHRVPPVANPNFGVSFVSTQAEWLGLPWREVYLAILDDLKVKNIRLQANWNEIEFAPGQYNFSNLDWQLDEAQRRGVEVTMSVGRKLPRWPECHEPDWVKSSPLYERHDLAVEWLKVSVEHFKGHTAIKRWQLENEPLFVFGDCPKPNVHLLQDEIAVLKALDSRPVLITDSGELSMWWETSGPADIQGVTMYQVTWNPVYGYGYYPVPAWWYRVKAAIISSRVEYTMVSELQMEPWGPVGIKDMDLNLARESFDLEQFRSNINFYKKTNLREAYLWGVEWWYQARVMGDASLWDEARILFSK